jgi:hypothetical protein
MKMEIRSRAIDKVYKRRDRIDMPDFQREEVWSDIKKRLLIDSILKGWHLPKFYFRKLDHSTFECIDGQQRMSAIFEFFDDELTFDDDLSRRYNATKYSELSDDLSDRFDDFEIEIEEIEEATEEDLEELFKRLQLGTPLNTAEKINAVMGQMRDFCHDIADRPFFGDKIALRDTRYSHFEIVVKWAFIEARSIQQQMRLPQLESLLRENRTFSRQSDTGRKITGAIDFLDRAFPDKCSILRNRANTLSICMLATRVFEQDLITEAAAREFRSFVESFFSLLTQEVEKGVKAVDKELIRYQNAISSDSGGGNSIRTRINILTKRLATFSPSFSPLLGAYHEISNEVTRNIAELAQTVREMLYEVNRKYSAAKGQDLFKMTNESSAALTKIGDPCRDTHGYEELIDSLYFLVYEGSGNCNRLPSPPPDFAMDVKILRNDIRHDANHGSESDVTKKRLRAGNIFEKYSVKKAPEECGPEEFLSAHIRLLTEMVSFLQML